MAVADAILAAVVGVIEGLPLTASLSVTVKARKTPTVAKGDAFPLALVALAEDRTEPATGEDDAASFVYYRVVVTLVNGTLPTLVPSGAWNGYRQAVKRALYRDSLAGASTVTDVEYEGRPFYPREESDEGYDRTGLIFVYESLEPRE